MAEVLIKNGINVSATDGVGSTALHRAAEKGIHFNQIVMVRN